MHMRIPYWKSIVRGEILEDDAMQQLYRIKIQYKQAHIVNHSQAKTFLTPLRNDQSHRNMKYHRNTNKNIQYIDMY